MRTAQMPVEEAALRLEASVLGLASRAPGVSARRRRSHRRLGVAAIVILVLTALLTLNAMVTVTVIVALSTGIYLAILCYRVGLFVLSSRPGVLVHVGDEEARALRHDELPLYTVLVPVFQESEVVSRLVEHLGRLEYPTERLDIKLLVEADDHETVEAVSAADPGPHFEVVVVPPADPRTKPKALNFGLTLARGEFVAIFDAEDIPDPLQLRRAVAGFRSLSPDVGCVQAKLSYFNPSQNLITRWFALEYAMWFSYFLPGLASLRAPIPLGGTSNHFRLAVLRAMGAWDPFNVTEDADLGIRMHRSGVKTAILDSTTLEEANSDFVNWVRQRSRWYKGYLQTFLVHFRDPRRLRRELGSQGTFHLGLFVGGTPVLALLNPVFWLLTGLWFASHSGFIQAAFPAPVYYAALLCLTFGNFLFLYLNVLVCRQVRDGAFVVAALLSPVYWVMMSMAAVKALWQLVAQPSHWEKTLHGLDQQT